MLFFQDHFDFFRIFFVIYHLSKERFHYSLTERKKRRNTRNPYNPQKNAPLSFLPREGEGKERERKVSRGAGNGGARDPRVGARARRIN